MNTTAIALPGRRLIHLDRIRGLYNGLGYVSAVSLLLAFWWTTQAALPQLLAGNVHAFTANFLLGFGWTLIAMIPGFALVPVFVNLAPRTGPARLAWLLTLTFVMGWWCLWIEGIHFGWDWPSLGYTLDGMLTPGMVVGLCAYHSDTREAADELLRSQISRTSLDSELMQARLQLLRAQIEPHFLFNTLSVVRSLSRTDRAATVAMLDNLIRYFEAALPRLRAGEVLLSEELQLVEAYLAIYQMRMGKRLSYQIDLQEGLERSTIPSMLLLTLVENALKHGVGPTVEGGLIRVSASCEQNRLLLRVADSGRGLDARLGRGSGLANLRQRLLMMYGQEATLTLRPADPRGVVASISVPVR
ncbi:MAG TPA: histidine kinase [Steroidobacteraceae bacterium]|nr:histidine kinase [Steroidobacteraceae bacterium]